MFNSPIKHLELTSDRVTHTAEGKFGQLYEIRVARQVENVEVGGLDGPGEAGPVLQAVAQSDADPGGAGRYRQGGVYLYRAELFSGAVRPSAWLGFSSNIVSSFYQLILIHLLNQTDKNDVFRAVFLAQHIINIT